MDAKSLVKLMVDYRNNPTTGNFSKDDNKEVIRQALIEANGGSSKLDLKSLRNNRNELFTIIELLVDATVPEGLNGDEFFMNMVEERNLALEDKPTFVVKGNSTVVTADIARGTQGLRRQRIGERTTVTLTPTPKGIL